MWYAFLFGHPYIVLEPGWRLNHLNTAKYKAGGRSRIIQTSTAEPLWESSSAAKYKLGGRSRIIRTPTAEPLWESSNATAEPLWSENERNEDERSEMRWDEMRWDESERSESEGNESESSESERRRRRRRSGGVRVRRVRRRRLEMPIKNKNPTLRTWGKNKRHNKLTQQQTSNHVFVERTNRTGKRELSTMNTQIRLLKEAGERAQHVHIYIYIYI